MRLVLGMLVVGAALSGVDCVPADEAIGLGSVSFTVTASRATQNGFRSSDGWNVTFDKVLLGFRTMTIGKIGVESQCSYRGRGATSDAVFDPRIGLVQTFNGIEPTECPDVGIVFTPPGDATVVGPGATSPDLVFLSTGPSAHAYIEATAKFPASGTVEAKELRIQLRFDTTRTSSRFGGCRTATRGIRIKEGERDEATVAFGAEHLFHNAISLTSPLRIAPFETADLRNDQNGIVTMTDLDALSLGDRSFERDASLANGVYQLPSGSEVGTFGDYIRAIFRFTIGFRAQGVCVGNEPGTDE